MLSLLKKKKNIKVLLTYLLKGMCVEASKNEVSAFLTVLFGANVKNQSG